MTMISSFGSFKISSIAEGAERCFLTGTDVNAVIALSISPTGWARWKSIGQISKDRASGARWDKVLAGS